MLQLRSVRGLRASRSNVQTACRANRRSLRRAERITMPRSLQHDRKLFGVTLTLCLVGAVMVFSASAVTLRQEGGHGYAFLIRQLLLVAIRSEERRVGKECRSRWS